MTSKELRIEYTEYRSSGEMSVQDRELVCKALQAMSNAYAPYSHYHVGAAVRLSDGSVVCGSNQENAAFPSGLCAERTAMFAASSQNPDKHILSLAVAGGPDGKLDNAPCTPCGACRQVMAQYQAKSGLPMSVILVGADRIWKFCRVEDILPFIFTGV